MTFAATLEMIVRPELLDSAPDLIHETLTATRAFDGCLSVEVLQDTSDPTRFIAVEFWESAEHDAAYRAWRATPDGAHNLGPALATPPVLVTYRTRPDL